MYVAVLILSTSECGLMWKQGFCRGNQGKMRSLDGPWFNMTGIPTKKKGNLGTETDVHRKDDMKTHREKIACDYSDASLSQRLPAVRRKDQKLEQAKDDSPLELSGRAWPYRYLGFKVVVSRTVKQ